jgi:hypothetical protein
MAAPVSIGLRTPLGTGAEILQIKCEWKQGESAVGEVRKGQKHFQEGEFESESPLQQLVGDSTSSVTQA